MANYSSKDLIFSITDHGGTPRLITAGLRSVGTVSVEAIIQESTPYGSAVATYLSTGIKKAAQIVIGGFYDDAATTGLDVMFSGYEGDTRAVIVTWGGGKTSSFSALVVKYDRSPKVSAETECAITLQPTGAVTEA